MGSRSSIQWTEDVVRLRIGKTGRLLDGHTWDLPPRAPT